MTTAFGELRSLVAGVPSAQAFGELLDEAQRAYLVDALSRWAKTLPRPVPQAWRRAFGASEEPRWTWRLCNTLGMHETSMNDEATATLANSPYLCEAIKAQWRDKLTP